MSVLLVGMSGELGRELAHRLMAQGDEVRVVEPDEKTVQTWREIGAHVAPGLPTDFDLIERAAQNARTVVVGEPAAVGAVIEGARGASVERVVFCGPRRLPRIVDALAGSGMDYIIVWTGARRRGKTRVPTAAVAEALDAADDLTGNPRLELDLTDPQAWRALNLTPPP